MWSHFRYRDILAALRVLNLQAESWCVRTAPWCSSPTRLGRHDRRLLLLDTARRQEEAALLSKTNTACQATDQTDQCQFSMFLFSLFCVLMYVFLFLWASSSPRLGFATPPKTSFAIISRKGKATDFILITDCQPNPTVYRRWPSFPGRRCLRLEQSAWSCHFRTFHSCLPVSAQNPPV